MKTTHAKGLKQNTSLVGPTASSPLSRALPDVQEGAKDAAQQEEGRSTPIGTPHPPCNDNTVLHAD